MKALFAKKDNQIHKLYILRYAYFDFLCNSFIMTVK